MVAVGVLVLAGCGSSGVKGKEERKLTVVASFYPLAYFAQQIGGSELKVVTLVPPGVEAHDWEPSPRDIVALQEASLFVYNGAGFEPWVPRVLAAVSRKDTEVVEATRGLPLLMVGAGSRSPDPHVWLDPVLAQRQVEMIRDALAKVDPDRGDVYRKGGEVLSARLAALHAAFQDGLDRCQSRTVVTPHAAFGYLAQRYNLEIIAVAGLSPEVEPSPARLAEVVSVVRERGVRYIFFETLVSPALSETIAREIGARTLVFNPLEGLTREELAAGEDYFTVMQRNLGNLRLALGCQ
ncbi:MAG: zinc ABC transporter substrate-binding protein [Chloroflexi bacterium]|nr:zinc ABC transporter substrate-binding protein [Chloroflexota bacterium]